MAYRTTLDSIAADNSAFYHGLKRDKVAVIECLDDGLMSAIYKRLPLAFEALRKNKLWLPDDKRGYTKETPSARYSGTEREILIWGIPPLSTRFIEDEVSLREDIIRLYSRLREVGSIFFNSIWDYLKSNSKLLDYAECVSNRVEGYGFMSEETIRLSLFRYFSWANTGSRINMNEHIDNPLTLAPVADVDGYRVKTSGWRNPKYGPSEVLVVPGVNLEILTSGEIKAVKHKVLGPRAKRVVRHSTVFDYNPRLTKEMFASNGTSS